MTGAALFTLDDLASIVRNPTKDLAYQQTRLGAIVREYLAWKRIGRTRPRTLDKYERVLARLSIRLGDHGVSDVTTGDLILFLETYPPGSWHGARAALNGFFKYAVMWDMIDRNPCDKLPQTKPPPPEVYDIFSHAEQAAIVNAARGSLLPIVDVVRVGILLNGARKGGCLALKVGDVNLADRNMVLREKGDKQRLVPVRGDFVRHFDEFLLTPLPFLNRTPGANDYVFFPAGSTGIHVCSKKCKHKTDTGTRGREQLTWIDPARPLSSTGYQHWWKQLMGRAGVKYRKGHMMRHTYATDVLDATDGDLIAVRDLLGHASTKTAETYIHSSRKRHDAAADRLDSYRRTEA